MSTPLVRALIGVAAVAVLQPAALAAQERIRAYDSVIELQTDGSIDVVERITVRAEGDQIRRGIYRDIPTRYQDRFSNRVRIDLEVLGVERNGEREEWFTERQSNGIRINTGGDDYLPTLPAEYTFTLRYRISRQIGFFPSHDELYFNAIGTGWVFPIESSTVTVRLPESVPVDSLGAEAYTGPQGATGTAYNASIPEPGVAVYRLTEPLQPFEGFTIVLTFPKGLIAEPTQAQRASWLLRDNAGVLIALAGLLVLLIYSAVVWWRVGRDPRRGVIIPRYYPPAEHTPAALRFLRRMGYDMRCFSADLLSLAVGGHVRIVEEKKWLSRRWKLERTAVAATPDASVATRTAAVPTGAQRVLLESLFASGRNELELHKKHATTIAAARTVHSKALESALQPRYFQRHGGKVTIALVLIIATAAAAFHVADGAGTFAIIAVLLPMLLVLKVFGSLVRAPTAEGRRLLDEIEGLKLYLGVAERDRIARLQAPEPAPELSPEHYEALLPYAVALDVEEAWTEQFTRAAGAAAVAEATQRMGWYGGNGRASDLNGFSKAIGSSLTSSISSASTPPGSSSGSGGGGSSGGGGGGGGGGGR